MRSNAGRLAETPFSRLNGDKKVNDSDFQILNLSRPRNNPLLMALFLSVPHRLIVPRSRMPLLYRSEVSSSSWRASLDITWSCVFYFQFFFLFISLTHIGVQQGKSLHKILSAVSRFFRRVNCSKYPSLSQIFIYLIKLGSMYRPYNGSIVRIFENFLNRGFSNMYIKVTNLCVPENVLNLKSKAIYEIKRYSLNLRFEMSLYIFKQ